MKFYDCATAPSPRRVRMFIAEKGLSDQIETVEVNLREAEQLKPAFREINPYCTVPVLELDDGTRLYSTAGCCRYLEEAYPEPPLMGRSTEEK
ncbi:MAG: glutathione S-transferase N-terminal domain-containing protein, partial [Alphaproteobacteria bacterium]